MTVREQAAYINTDVLENTTFYAIPEMAVTVTNAPTSFDEVTTFKWTEYDMRARGSGLSSNFIQSPTAAAMQTMANPTLAMPTGSPFDSFFVMFLDMGPANILGGVNAVGRRQNSGGVCTLTVSKQYVSGNGTVTNDCLTAPLYTITEGVLIATVNNVNYTYSTNPGLPYSPFVPSQTPGPITTRFSIGSSGALAWWNDAFWNGQAQFCAVSNGSVYAVFQQDAQPAGCSFVSLSLFTPSPVLPGPLDVRYRVVVYPDGYGTDWTYVSSEWLATGPTGQSGAVGGKNCSIVNGNGYLADASLSNRPNTNMMGQTGVRGHYFRRRALLADMFFSQLGSLSNHLTLVNSHWKDWCYRTLTDFSQADWTDRADGALVVFLGSYLLRSILILIRNHFGYYLKLTDIVFRVPDRQGQQGVIRNHFRHYLKLTDIVFRVPDRQGQQGAPRATGFWTSRRNRVSIHDTNLLPKGLFADDLCRSVGPSGRKLAFWPKIASGASGASGQVGATGLTDMALQFRWAHWTDWIGRRMSPAPIYRFISELTILPAFWSFRRKQTHEPILQVGY
ncbi:uncharacterized protein MYCFIDRAFT_174398 [Pseudocercospora fijiensis CIRAD86]|uniref:DUF7908 domain-containing protein n=1 Tax=Pseudocercospora fijiensis (strain CIRAD86) TaxID=383855 RepID=M3B0C1_PSEFD|nr:uncharacterized protein MYCFIDRAFT_174398 [Pseudocercospora fijiensis CIRAD86]EME82882.1 hypothetical protein MYCFIDRAFT_174398 [Pseudocercospora fijiensis CIRAD86]